MPILYTTKATSTGGRAGSSRTEDGALSVTLTVPKELGGDGAPGNNPEQLFAAGYSACFLGAFKFVASKEKIKIPDDARVTATVGMGPREDGGGFGIDVKLEIHVPGLDKAEVQRLADAAHVVCPYSHALRVPRQVPTTVV